MSSFGTHRARVHDAARPPRWRLSDLRSCLVHFAPYGFGATFHHLRGSAGIPQRPEDDPDALVRAVEELHEARLVWQPAGPFWSVALLQTASRAPSSRTPVGMSSWMRLTVVWLAAESAYARRRTREKRSGRRQPAPADAWRARWRGCNGIAYCPDPRRHPTDPLPVVVRRLLHAPPVRGPREHGADGRAVCWVCAGPTTTRLWHNGYWTHTLCTACGVSLHRE